MFYDPIHNDVVLSGGETFPSSGSGGAQTLEDAWILNAGGWHQQSSIPPPGVGAPVEDPGSGEFIAMASPSSSGQDLQTWSWDGRTWSRLADLPSSTDRALGLAQLGSQLLLVTANADDTATQSWTWTGSSWSLRHPATSLPFGVAGPLIAADPAHHQVVAILTANASGATQTWAWDGSTWHVIGSTDKLGLDPITATMTMDPQTGELLLYMNPAGSNACTWALTGTTWQEVGAASPNVDTAYNGAALLTDTAIGRVILIGGATRPNPLDVLWVLDGSTWTAEPASVLGG